MSRMQVIFWFKVISNGTYIRTTGQSDSSYVIPFIDNNFDWSQLQISKLKGWNITLKSRVKMMKNETEMSSRIKQLRIKMISSLCLAILFKHMMVVLFNPIWTVFGSNMSPSNYRTRLKLELDKKVRHSTLDSRIFFSSKWTQANLYLFNIMFYSI